MLNSESDAERLAQMRQRHMPYDTVHHSYCAACFLLRLLSESESEIKRLRNEVSLDRKVQESDIERARELATTFYDVFLHHYRKERPLYDQRAILDELSGRIAAALTAARAEGEWRMRERLDRYRYAVAWAAADSWDNCAECRSRFSWARAFDPDSMLSDAEMAEIAQQFLDCEMPIIGVEAQSGETP